MDSFFKNDKNLKWVRRLVFISVPVVVLVFVFLYSISGITKFPVQVKMTGKHSFISDERIQIVERHAKMNTVLENGASIITITSPKFEITYPIITNLYLTVSFTPNYRRKHQQQV